jgi:hypothetical protein
MAPGRVLPVTQGTRRPLWIAGVLLAGAVILVIFGRPGHRDGPQSPPGNLGLLSVLSPPSDGSCLSRDRAMSIIASSGAPHRDDPPAFCTTRPEITDWITVEDMADLRHYAFDPQGCMVAWEPAGSCP